MLIYEYKVAGTQKHYAAIDEAIRITQFIRNKCLRKWMDERGVSTNDLQCYCAVLAKEYSFASLLNSRLARWLLIVRGPPSSASMTTAVRRSRAKKALLSFNTIIDQWSTKHRMENRS